MMDDLIGNIRISLVLIVAILAAIESASPLNVPEKNMIHQFHYLFFPVIIERGIPFANDFPKQARSGLILYFA